MNLRDLAGPLLDVLDAIVGRGGIESFHVARPELLWALPVILIVYAYLRGRATRRMNVPHAPLQFARSRPDKWRRAARRAQMPIELALVATLIFALAGPHRFTELELTGDEGIDVMLVLDISLSMLAEDFPPTRLDALRSIASDFVSRGGPNRLGIIAFAADAFAQSPLTTNQAILKSLLDDVSVHALNQSLSGGTAIGTALLVAADVLERSKVEGRDQALILITDGESNRGADPILGARYVRELGVRTYIIGIGGTEPVQVFFQGEPVGTGDSPYLAVLDDAQLQAIAAEAGGVYVRASERDALEEIFGHLARLESAPLVARTVSIRRGVSAPLAVLALPLFAAYLGLSGIVLRRPYR
jgi:Ca-activated chloride channel family protein